MATAAKKTPAAKTGTAVAVKKPSSGALVSIKEQMAAELASLASRTAPPSGAKIKAKKTGFTMPDGTETDTFDCVIIDFVTAHNFYPGKYDPKNIVPPDCAARGEIPTAMMPFADAPDVQSDSCSVCPMNQFGSDGDGKACKNSRLLAVLPPDADESTPIWLLEVSPTAIKGFDGYVGSVARSFQMPPIGVITTVSLDPNVDYAKIVFGNPQPNANIEAHFPRRVESREMLMLKPSFEQRVATPAKGSGKKVANGRR